jgi:ATP-dependent RNA helicase DeaD
MSFFKSSLNPQILKALDSWEIDTPSPIQEQVFEEVKQGRDVMGVSKTGSGKTLAYLLPMLQHGLEQGARMDVLVLEPTRELVQQVFQVTETLVEDLPFEAVKICGGETLVWPKGDASKIIVATPGRLLKSIENNEIELNFIKSVVLDEADQFFQQGFIDILQQLLSKFTSEYQSLMFSATMPSSLEKFSQQFLVHPKVVNLTKKNQMVAELEHHFQLLLPNRKLEAIQDHLKKNSETRVLIFCNTKFISERLYKQLQHSEKDIDWLHGDLEQKDRNRVFDAFRKGKVRVLITTDVAARGVDIQNLDVVISYDFPYNKEAFLHRSGRTGRMGRKGSVITFVCIEELLNCRSVLEQTKLKPNWLGSEPDFKEFENMKYKAPKKHRGPASPRAKRRP